MTRPRSIEAHEKVIQAALTLFSERGIEAASMDAIARASGVSKATIYNHWTDKETLLLEVMVRVNGLDREPEDVDTGDLQRDLAAELNRKPPGEFEAARNRLMPFLISYAAVHPEFGQAWRRRVMEPPRMRLQRVLKRAVERGALPQDVDFDLAISLLLGPILYDHIFNKDQGKKRKDIADQTAKVFVRGFVAK